MLGTLGAVAAGGAGKDAGGMVPGGSSADVKLGDITLGNKTVTFSGRSSGGAGAVSAVPWVALAVCVAALAYAIKG